jgi:hypothetical protein
VPVRIAADRMSARRGAARSVQSISDQDSSFSAQRTMPGSCVRSQTSASAAPQASCLLIRDLIMIRTPVFEGQDEIARLQARDASVEPGDRRAKRHGTYLSPVSRTVAGGCM